MCERKKARKPTVKEFEEAQQKYFAKVERYAVGLGMKYLNQFFRDMRRRDMRRNGFAVGVMGRSQWMKATHRPKYAGGFLTHGLDEIIPHMPSRLEDLDEHLCHIGEEPEHLYEKWRREADAAVKYPTILDRQPCDVPNEEPSRSLPSMIGMFKRRKIDKSEFDGIKV